MRAILLILAAALLLAGCAGDGVKGSIAGGECKVFERPPYAVRGLKPYDQNWIDSQIEGGVGACGWKRPLPRPDAIDAGSTVAAKPAPPAKKKRRGIVARIKAAVHREPEAPPAVVAPAVGPTTPEAQPESVVVPQPRPRSRLELLLDKSGPAVRGAD